MANTKTLGGKAKEFYDQIVKDTNNIKENPDKDFAPKRFRGSAATDIQKATHDALLKVQESYSSVTATEDQGKLRALLRQTRTAIMQDINSGWVNDRKKQTYSFATNPNETADEVKKTLKKLVSDSEAIRLQSKFKAPKGYKQAPREIGYPEQAVGVLKENWLPASLATTAGLATATMGGGLVWSGIAAAGAGTAGAGSKKTWLRTAGGAALSLGILWNTATSDGPEIETPDNKAAVTDVDVDADANFQRLLNPSYER